MKKRRKHSRCLNCGEPLERRHNYCPNCGQENTDHQISIGMLIREFTSSIFSLDSRFAHTILPFLIRPGKITNAFIEGRRVHYANPIRWYLVFSIINFFFMSKVFEPSVHDRKQIGFGSSEELTDHEFDSLYHLPDTVLNNGSWPLSNPQQKMVGHLVKMTDLTATEIQDSLKLHKEHWANDFATNKFIKMNQETTASLNGYLLRQVPLIIFFILPIYAFLLKIFFWKKGLYIKHLVHSLHLHSFFFFLLGIMWILALIFDGFEETGMPLAVIITFVYAIISFKNVYKIKIIWSIFRASWIGLVYLFALSTIFVIGIIISLALI